MKYKVLKEHLGEHGSFMEIGDRVECNFLTSFDKKLLEYGFIEEIKPENLRRANFKVAVIGVVIMAVAVIMAIICG